MEIHKIPHPEVCGGGVVLTTCKLPSGDILQRGGSAVDGAIAALLCTSVINPQSMGIGGGPYSRTLLSLFSINGQKIYIFTTFLQVYPFYTYQWISASFFHTTIKLAREGFHVPQVLTIILSSHCKKMTFYLFSSQLFIGKDGILLKVGNTVKFETFADTLEIIANQGADAFYTGKVAADLICNIKDMLLCRSKYSLLTYQRYIEACKFSNGLRKYICPFPSFDQRALKFTEQQFADHFRAMFSGDETHDAQYNIVTPYLDTMGNTHVSVMAEDGTAVSVICTINHMFGSRVFSPITSVIFNNELSDVCGNADHNATLMICFMVWLASEQPPSSMSAVVFQSKYKTLVSGGSGGSMITTGMALTHLLFGKSLEEAIAVPVGFVDCKNALKFDQITALGHTVKVTKYSYNVVNTVEKDNAGY
uniref:Gamma-glutamyltransferase 5a n=1 Tax=Oncorhynchus kisutch TaxID=8019 RepID=A0A8C7I789_ONCKI